MKKLKNPVVALGIFDGVHIGHRKVLNEAIKRASAIGGTSIALTFSPHPLKMLAPRKAPPLLTSTEHRLRLIKSLGVDLCCIVRFDKKFSNQNYVSYTPLFDHIAYDPILALKHPTKV